MFACAGILIFTVKLETRGSQNNIVTKGGTILSLTEFRDALVLRYARVTSYLPTSCEGYSESKKFDVDHALDCKRVDWSQLDTTKFVTNSEIY